MLFNSWGYIFFLLIFVPLHWALPHRSRIFMIAACNLSFYAMWRWDFLFVMLFSASVDYLAGLMIHRSDDERVRKRWLWGSLSVNFGLLAFFKYTYFLYDNTRGLAALLGIEIPPLALNIILPLGISFYTFHSVSYTVDVYRRVLVPTRNYLTFVTFVTLWPQLMAGPILRANEVIPQIEKKRGLNRHDVAMGLERIIQGLFKKAVLADYAARFVDEGFALDPGLLSALDVWVLAFLFGFQIYFDFAGYSDMAIGSARLLGFHFPENFNWPYMALSPKEFWKRWHISLSSWIRDYLYLPLTGSKFRTQSVGGISVATEDDVKARTTSALFLTWLIMGFWHGANWTFAFWGLYHATLIYFYRSFSFYERPGLFWRPFAWVIMLFASMAAWILFRAAGMWQALSMYGKILNPYLYGFSNKALPADAYYTAFFLVLGMAVVYLLVHVQKVRAAGFVLKPLTIAAMTYFILVFLKPNQQFIYFQF